MIASLDWWQKFRHTPGESADRFNRHFVRSVRIGEPNCPVSLWVLLHQMLQATIETGSVLLQGLSWAISRLFVFLHDRDHGSVSGRFLRRILTWCDQAIFYRHIVHLLITMTHICDPHARRGCSSWHRLPLLISVSPLYRRCFTPWTRPKRQAASPVSSSAWGQPAASLLFRQNSGNFLSGLYLLFVPAVPTVMCVGGGHIVQH